ncbi:hypothetical protein O3P69_008470 [Scylla paramamosain]|uniref:Uncharacterized protein n=1 Tax=Scylla paramamosain TaxID=85552 RepID=A0AAW0SK20_SCYPA
MGALPPRTTTTSTTTPAITYKGETVMWLQVDRFGGLQRAAQNYLVVDVQSCYVGDEHLWDMTSRCPSSTAQLVWNLDLDHHMNATAFDMCLIWLLLLSSTPLTSMSTQQEEDLDTCYSSGPSLCLAGLARSGEGRDHARFYTNDLEDGSRHPLVGGSGGHAGTRLDGEAFL